MASSTDLHLRLLIDANGNAAISEINRVRTGVAGVGNAATTASAASSGMLQSIVGLGAGVFAVDRIAAAIGNMVSASAEASRAATKLETALIGVGGATASQVDGLKGLAQSLQDVTGYDGDATIAAQARLATYGLTADEIARLTPGLLDMAEAARKSGSAEADLENIAKALGKARMQGVEALRKYGVAVTDGQAAEFEAATGMERTALLAKLLGERFGGLAAAVGKDFDGAIRRAAAAQGDLAEALGDLVTQGDGGNAFMATYTDALKAASAAIQDNAEGLRTLLGDAGYTAVGAALIYAASQGAQWVAGQRAQAAAATEAAAAARMEALAVASSARSKALAASGSATIARTVAAEAAATLANVRALGVEQPYLLRTVSYQKRLAAARLATSKASAALVAAELASTKALAGSAAAAAAAEAAAAKQGLTWKTLTSGTTLLSAAMTAMISLEVGRWLRGLAEDSEIGRRGIAGLDHALGSLSETYRLAVEAEQRKAETDARVAARLKEVSAATGLAIKDMDEFNRVTASGQVVWNAQTSAWERGTVVVGGLAEGLGEVDTAYARLADVLERSAKLEESQATARQTQIKAAADAAKALGDERGALELLAQARSADVTAAERQVEFQRALLAETERRIAQQARETDANASGHAARQALLVQLQEEEGKRRTALTLAEATVAQARVEADQAKLATQTYGDQSASLGKLIAQRNALTAAQQAGQDTITQATVAQNVLTTAQDHARATAEAYTNALLAGGDTTDLVAGAQQAQQAVAALESIIAKGTASAQNAATINRDLAVTQQLLADAAKDAAQNIELDIQANERSLTVAQARLALEADEANRLAARATARGHDIEALLRSADAVLADAKATELASSAKDRDAALLTERARLLEIAGKATGDYTREEQAQVAAMRDAAELAGIEADRMHVAAKAKREAADETQRLAEQQSRLKAAFEGAGLAGVRSMEDVRAAIARAASGPELEALGAGLEAAIQAGVNKAGELSTALAEVQAKMDGLESKTRRASVSYEQLFKQYGTDTGRYRKSALAGLTGEQGQQAVDAYQAWLREQGFGGGAQAKARDQMTAREVAQAAASSPVAAQQGYRRVVDINLRGAGETATVTAASEDEAERVVRVLRAAQRGAT